MKKINRLQALNVLASFELIHTSTETLDNIISSDYLDEEGEEAQDPQGEGVEGGMQSGEAGTSRESRSGGKGSGEGETGAGTSETGTGEGGENETGTGGSGSETSTSGDGGELEGNMAGESAMDQKRLDELFADEPPVKKVLLDALKNDAGTGIHLDEDFVKRFLQLDFHDLAPDSDAFKKILEELKKLDGETIMDRNKLLDRLQKMLDGEELPEEKKEGGESGTGTDGKTESDGETNSTNTTKSEQTGTGGKNATTQPSSRNTTQTDPVKTAPQTDAGPGVGKAGDKKETDTFIKEESKATGFENAPPDSQSYAPLGFRIYTTEKIPTVGRTFLGIVDVYYMDDGIKKYYRLDEKEVRIYVKEKHSNYYLFLLVDGATVELDGGKHKHYYRKNYQMVIYPNEISRP